MAGDRGPIARAATVGLVTQEGFQVAGRGEFPQLIAGQCSGTLVLAQLGLLNDVPACTDLITAAV